MICFAMLLSPASILHSKCSVIESEPGVDVRKKLFFAAADKGWAIVGLEALGMSLEDIFINVVDKTEDEVVEAKTKRERGDKKRARRTRTTLEKDLATELVSDAEKRREDAAGEEVTFDD